MGVIRPLLSAALVWLAFAATTRAAQPSTSDVAAPTAVERALVDLRCDAIPLARVPGTAVRNECERAQLSEIRSEFGRDLGRLSVRNRRTLDATCGPLLTPRSREAYVECLDAELTSFRNSRRSQGQKPRPEALEALEALKDAPAADAPAAPALPVVPGTADTSQRVDPAVQGTGGPAVVGGRSGLLWVVASIIGVVGIAAIWRLKSGAPTTAPRVCKTCGAPVPDGGDLCPSCRHHAVEALKQAAEQRAAGAAEERDAARRVEQEHAAELARERARAEAAEREEHARRAVLDRLAEQERQRREDEQQAAPRVEEDQTTELDASSPYAVLGVSAGASQADVTAAYEAALARYDASLAADFGLEVQKHYDAKRAAIERAYADLAHPVDV